MKWIGSLVGALGKAFSGGSVGAVGRRAAAMNAMGNFKFQLIPIGLGLLLPGTPQEKMENIAWNMGAFYLTLGMNSPWRQAFWGIGLSMIPMYGKMARGLLHGYRGALESRTSAHIPFSHNTLAMDQAFATLQYSQTRLQDANMTLSGQASMFAAKYMSR